jgi:hypothetical protein
MADFASTQRGESIRLRRRPAAAAGAVAFVVAVLAVYLALTRWQSPLAVTDVAAPGPAQDLVASGKVGNASWQIIVKPSPYVQQPGQVCWFGQGSAFADPITGRVESAESCGKLHPPPVSFGDNAPPAVHPDPVQFDNWAQEHIQVALGLVRADVTSVVLRLDDGQQLKLIPVHRYGYRLVAYVIPRQVGIADATAYLNNGQYETTIASNSGGLSFFPQWLWHGPRGH